VNYEEGVIYMPSENKILTSLHSNPFYLFGATTRDNRQKLVELIEGNLSVDPAICEKTRSDLTNPRKRTTYEMSWLPGISPKQALYLIDTVVSNPGAIMTGNYPELSHANLIAAIIECHKNGCGDYILSDWICGLAKTFDKINPLTIQRDINEDRAISGFPAVTNSEFIENELNERKQYYCNVIKGALDSVPTQELIKIMIKIVGETTGNGNQHAPLIIDQLVDIYEVEVQGFLDKEFANAQKIVETIKNLDKSDSRQMSKNIDKLETVARNWNRVAQPIKVNAKARGIEHDYSSKFAYSIRKLALSLFNEHDKLAESRRLTMLLNEVFTELPEIAELTLADISTLTDIESSRREKDILKPIYEACDTAVENIESNPDKANHYAKNILNETIKTFSCVVGKSILQSVVQDAKNTVALVVMRCAIAYGNKTEDWKECVELLEKALPYAEDHELINKIEDNLQTTRTNSRLIGDFKPVSSAPPLRTINGIGFTLYGESDNDPSTCTYSATYYFCFFFVPLIPICRYRVTLTGVGHYIFRGKGPLRTFDKVHLAIVIAIILWIFISAK
jgi:hypothetical protein